jgi:two-component system chemotaxis sensor kinase CheA
MASAAPSHPGAPGTAAPAAAAAGPPIAAAARLRIVASRLDDLIFHAEGLHQPVAAIGERIGDARRLVGLLHTAGRPAATGADAATPSAPADARTRERQAREIVGRLAADHRALRQNLDAVMDDARRLRMVPVGSILEVMPGMVRDIAAAEGKDAAWQARGVDIVIDRSILQTLKDPILHIVRNAVAHGIETPQERRAAGKPPTGTVRLSVAIGERNTVVLTVTDDGRGLDYTALRRTAVGRGLMTAERAERLADDDLAALLWSNGFSTTRFISDVAGRGIGLSVVKDRVETIGGSVALAAEPGRGTTVTLTVPNALSLLRALKVRAAGQAFLIPATAIRRVVRPGHGDYETTGGRRMLRLGGDTVPVDDLAAVLGLATPPAPTGPGAAEGGAGSGMAGDGMTADGMTADGGTGDSPAAPCCVLLATARPAAVRVDDLGGVVSVVPRNLGPPLDRVRNVAAATLLPNGEIAYILRASDLAASVEAGLVIRRSGGDPAAERPEVVLVVDDSVTTRIMEKNLLEASGYDVRLAKDGLDALEVLKREPVDLIVSDVDMPVMDGFELTARVRADPALATIPVILVTAMESPEDKRRGMDLGANAYIVKSQFDESQLLDIVRRVS